MLFFFLCCLVSVSAVKGPEIDHFIESDHVSEGVEGKISGGQEVDSIKSVPYQAQVFILITFCGGAIVSERRVLTAAHCVAKASPKIIVIRAGSLVRGEGVRNAVDEVILHPEYDNPRNNFDIAVLRTTERFVFSDNIRPGVLGKYPLPNRVTVAGWGRQGRAERIMLRNVTLAVINNMLCQVQYPELTLTKNIFCAENTRDGGQGTCEGDGGGAASYGRHRLIGISSFTKGCGSGTSPSGFTYLQAKEVRDFITNVTGIHYKNATHQHNNHLHDEEF